MNQIITKEQTKLIKGIAITFVIISHLGAQFTRVLTPLGGIGVALFLTISGYGLEKSYQRKGLKCFWSRRILTVILPYTIAECCMYVLGQVEINIYELILDILLIAPVQPWAWYLNYLFLWYIFFWVIHIMVQNDPRQRLVVFVGISILCAIVFNYFSPIRFEQSFSFLFGIVLAYYEKSILDFKERKSNLIVIVGACCVGGAGLVLLCKQFDVVREAGRTVLNFFDLAIKLSSMVGIILLFIVLEKHQNYMCLAIKRILSLMGNFAFQLYMIHGYMMNIFDVFDDKIKGVVWFLIIIASSLILLEIVNTVIRSKTVSRRI